MVRVKISGGLGNQMFQYIYGQYLKILLNKKIFYVAKMSSNSSSFTKRSLDLENFDVPNFQYSESRISFWERVFRKFILIFPMLNRKYIIQQNPHDIPDIERSVNYYDGYWQNYIYYNVVKEKIGNPFTLSQEDLFKYESIINEIKNEMKSEDSSTEEMLRILLKLIILKSTRIWKKQHYLENDDLQTEVNFLRKFS
jgi:hypothetical protein